LIGFTALKLGMTHDGKYGNFCVAMVTNCFYGN